MKKYKRNTDMGIIVTKDEDKNNDLNRRITADLRERAKVTERQADPDLVDDSDYVKDFSKTSHFGWFWIILILLAAGVLIGLVFF